MIFLHSYFIDLLASLSEKYGFFFSVFSNRNPHRQPNSGRAEKKKNKRSASSANLSKPNWRQSISQHQNNHPGGFSGAMAFRLQR